VNAVWSVPEAQRCAFGLALVIRRDEWQCCLVAVGYACGHRFLPLVWVYIDMFRRRSVRVSAVESETAAQRCLFFHVCVVCGMGSVINGAGARV